MSKRTCSRTDYNRCYTGPEVEAVLFKIDEKYYVTHSLGDDLLDFSKDAWCADELIAESLQSLCNKGYITEYSCSGHPYNTCYLR